MGTIILEGLEFFARHGFYEEEKKLGNRFIVDIVLETDFTQAAKYDVLDGTVNYENVYAVVQEEMAIPSKLIENAGYRIMKRLFDTFQRINTIEVRLSKMNPPLGGICRSATVVLKDFRM